jgi:hypothetical protein
MRRLQITSDGMTSARFAVFQANAPMQIQMIAECRIAGFSDYRHRRQGSC